MDLFNREHTLLVPKNIKSLILTFYKFYRERAGKNLFKMFYVSVIITYLQAWYLLL